MISGTSAYLKVLLSSLHECENLSFAEKNGFWFKRYLTLQDDIRAESVKVLPNIMALIHPEFLVDSKGVEIGHLINLNRSNFSEAISDSDQCQISQIDTQGSCEFNNYRKLRQKCHADHHWPYSLGGPTILENRVLLCRFHNVAKSNSILNYFWNNYPSWLNNHINRISNLKK